MDSDISNNTLIVFLRFFIYIFESNFIHITEDEITKFENLGIPAQEIANVSQRIYIRSPFFLHAGNWNRPWTWAC